MKPRRIRMAFCMLLVAAFAACGRGRPSHTASRPSQAEPTAPTPSGEAAGGPPPALPSPGALASRQKDSGTREGTGSAMSPEPTKSAAGERVIALVNGRPITTRDLEIKLAEIHTDSGEAGKHGSFDLKHLMFRMVNDLLIAQEARTLGMNREESIKSSVDAYRRQVMIRALEQERIDSRAEPTRAELESAFKDRCSRVSLRVITVDKKEGADALRATIEAGADMAELARARSIDPYAAKGGKLADVERRFLLPEVGALAFSLKPGQIGGPVRTDLGWSVLRVDGFKDPDPALFEDFKPILSNLVALRKSTSLRSALAEDLKRKHAIKIEGRIVREVQPERRRDGRLVPATGDRNAIVARIGEEVVLTRGEYSDALLRRWMTVRNEEAARASSPLILSNLLEEKLMLAEAMGLGYGARPDVTRQVRAHEDGLLVEKYLSEVVASRIQITRDEMQAYYQTHKTSFPRPPRLHLSQITVATAEEAKDIAEHLKQGADVTWLARMRSLDRFAASGGDRGWTVPEPGVDGFTDKFIAARVGDVLEPSGVPGDYTVIKVTAREDRGVYDFDEISGNVRQMLTSEKFRKALDNFITKLRARATIEVKESVLASLQVSGRLEKGAREGEGPPAHAH